MARTVEAKFEDWCASEGITSEQYKEDLRPAFEAGYRSGLATGLKAKPEKENGPEGPSS